MATTTRSRTWGAFAAGLAVAVGGVVAVEAFRVGAAPGDTDATFVPIVACRLADTRPAPDRVGDAGAFGTDDTKTFQAHGTNGNCTLPADATGVVLNVTAVTATEPTFLTVWSDGDRPLASSLNPTPGAPPTPNAVNVVLAGDGSFRVYNLAGTVEVIVDVTGYYTPSSLIELMQETERVEEFAKRSVGYSAAVVEGPIGGGSGVSGSPIAGQRVTLSMCDPGPTNCIDLTTSTFGSSDRGTGFRFDGRNRRFASFVERLTDGNDDILSITRGGVRLDGTILAGGSGSTAPESRWFRSGQVSSTPGIPDLSGFDIASITVVADKVNFDTTPGNWEFDVAFRTYFELPGAPVAPAPTGI